MAARRLKARRVVPDRGRTSKARPRATETPTDLLLGQIRDAGLPDPVLEYRFAPPRRWRFDMLWILGYEFYPGGGAFDKPIMAGQRVAVEVEGGIWVGGRHNRPAGFLKDIEKYNKATEMGFLVYRVTPSMIKSGEAIALLKRVLG